MNLDKRKMTRRQMLKASGVLGLAGALGAVGLRAADQPAAPAIPVLPQVPRRVLGKTGQKIPILLMGGGMKLDERFDPRFAECLRFGVNYFDVADCYAGGTSETAAGAFLARTGKRSEVWITTKSCDHSPEGLARVLEQSLKRLQTDHVDMMFMHGLKDPALLTPAMAQMSDKLKQAGKIRFFGFSCHDNTVADLLAKAAGLAWIDAIMFKYNFRDYGNQVLNAAMDACHKANVGLIAMKTQGSAVSFEDRVKKFEGSKFTKAQAVMKAVWEDERLTAAVSHMDTMEKIKANVAAALDDAKLSAVEHEALRQYAQATGPLYCAGCDHLCGAALPAGMQVGTTLRYLMYHDNYGDPQTARELFAQLPAAARQIDGVDFTQAAALCPRQVDIARHMRRAVEVLG